MSAEGQIPQKVSPAVDVLAVIDAEIRILERKRVTYQERAHRAYLRLGEPSCSADRLCDWVDYRINQLRSARERVAGLLRDAQAREGVPVPEGALVHGNADLVPSCLADGWAPR